MSGAAQRSRVARTRPNSTERMVVPRPSRIDLVQAYRLRVVNKLSFSEIAKTLKCAKSTVHAALERLHRVLPNPELVTAYQDVRPYLLKAVEEQLIASLMDKDKHKKASLNNVAFSFTQVFNARRLEEGQSTQNLSVLQRMMGKALGELYSVENSPHSNTQTSPQPDIPNGNGAVESQSDAQPAPSTTSE